MPSKQRHPKALDTHDRWFPPDDDDWGGGHATAKPSAGRLVVQAVLYSSLLVSCAAAEVPSLLGWWMIIAFPVIAFNAWGGTMKQGQPALAWIRAAVLIAVGWGVGGWLAIAF